MSHLRGAPGQVVAAAQAAGIRAGEDPRSLNPPALLVRPISARRVTPAQVEVEVEAVLVAPGPANLDAQRKLDDLIETLTPALDVAGIFWTAGRLVTTTSPSSGEDLLAYSLDITVTTEV